MLHHRAPRRPRIFRCLALAAFAVLAGAAAEGGNLHMRAPDLAAKYRAFTLVQGPQRRLLYGTYRGTLHLIESRGGKLVEVQQRELWSAVLKIVAADLDGDGQDEVVGNTQDGRLFVLRGTDLSDIWNTPQERFESISALTVGDVDRNGQMEIVAIADGLLRIFSGMRDIEEWKSPQPYTATEIAVGDVDGDQSPEIVLNTGVVLGAAFHDVKWEYPQGFGTEMDLFDVDADGILEIVAVGPDGLIRVFDADQHLLKPE